MKKTLQVNGREMTFSEEELIAIVEEHFNKQVTTKVAQKPTEDEWFEVKPQAIDQKLFEKEREDKRQEKTRQRILEAFAEMKNNPERYGKNFKTMMPKNTWSSRSVSVEQLERMASKRGDHLANWIEQALEWAQRITNGESWESICNNPDTARYYRLVEWKNGNFWFVGGCLRPASDADTVFCYQDFTSITVPLVVLCEREMTVSEQELIAIVEEYLSSKVQKPTENEWFEVKPQAIDQKLFEKEREDKKQEKTRQLILEAFDAMKNNPEKYGKNFKTMMPKKTWSTASIAELYVMASERGNHLANWIEQALEWAQRLTNGESWKSICNDDDTANWYRLVVWKNRDPKFVGGSVRSLFNCPASNVGYTIEDPGDTVPLIVTTVEVAQKPTEDEWFAAKAQDTQQATTAKVAQKPTEDEWFEVKPQSIDQKLFEKKRNDKRQEKTRQLILEAFAEMKDNPEYGKNFKTMMPKKTWSWKTVTQLKEMASERGDRLANWIEQAFEWAQRITNGESWESICNDPDTARCYRLVEWKNGYVRIVGGPSSYGFYLHPASDLKCFFYDDRKSLGCTVPLVVLYE